MSAWCIIELIKRVDKKDKMRGFATSLINLIISVHECKILFIT